MKTNTIQIIREILSKIENIKVPQSTRFDEHVEIELEKSLIQLAFRRGYCVHSEFNKWRYSNTGEKLTEDLSTEEINFIQEAIPPMVNFYYNSI